MVMMFSLPKPVFFELLRMNAKKLHMYLLELTSATPFYR
jgi:hypothetical protein